VTVHGTVRRLPRTTRMGAHRYEDLVAWQLANELKEKVYDLIDNSPARNDFDFRDQIKDSSSSAPANISEGFGYYYHKQFARHVRIARASEMETHNHLGDGVKRGHWTEEKMIPLQQLAKTHVAPCTVAPLHRCTVAPLHHCTCTVAPGLHTLP